MHRLVLFLLSFVYGLCFGLEEFESVGLHYEQSGMQVMHSPWRDAYNKPSGIKKNTDFCAFCRHSTQEDFEEKKFVLFQDEDVVVLLTLYPYHDGHIIIFSRDHVRQIHDLPDRVVAKIMQVTSKVTSILEKELDYSSFNIGVNIGRASGASIPDHVHLHVVPRKEFDIGFLQIIGQVNHIKINLENLFKRLKPVFDKEFLG